MNAITENTTTAARIARDGSEADGRPPRRTEAQDAGDGVVRQMAGNQRDGRGQILCGAADSHTDPPSVQKNARIITFRGVYNMPGDDFDIPTFTDDDIPTFSDVEVAALDDETRELLASVAKADTTRHAPGERLPVVRARRPRCPYCRSFKFIHRSSREAGFDLLDVHALCKACGRRFRLLLDGDY